MKLNIPAFLDSLQYMGQGMIGIFLVTGIIILAVLLLNKLGSGKSNKDDK